MGNYEIKCKTCGRRRGNHYSNNSQVIFCSHADLKFYKETGIIRGRLFEPLVQPNQKSEIMEQSVVIMNESDPWAKKGQIGVIVYRHIDSVRIKWNNGTTFSHSLHSVSLLKNTKDPNLLFLVHQKQLKE